VERPTLKRYAELNGRDLTLHPIWLNVHGIDEAQPWYGETDEVTYRPWDRELPLERLAPSVPDVAARASLTLADGSLLTGFLTLPVAAAADDRSPNRLQPILFLPNGTSVGLYVATYRLAQEAMAKLLGHLHRNRSKVFPIRYEVSEQVASPSVLGELAGIYYLRSLRPREIAVL
jgi:hypothetical protein